MNVNPAAPKKWTVLLYSAADNDMMAENIKNVVDIETVGSDATMNIVAQVDTGVKCDRYLLQKAARPSAEISSPSLQTSGPVDMSDPKTLADFVTWGVKKFPAQHYLVIVSDHGYGWQGAVQDDSHKDWMPLSGLRQGFEAAQQATGQKIDVIGFDACLMASTEVAHELSGLCDYMVGSQESEGGAGWPYTRILTHSLMSRLHNVLPTSAIEVGPRALAEMCVRDAATTQDELPTMSAIDMSRMPQVTAAFDRLAQTIAAAPAGSLTTDVSATQAFDEYRDATDFAQRLQNNPALKGTPVQAAASDLVAALDGAVIAEQHEAKYAGAHGLTVELSTKGVPEGYGDTKFARDTRWPEALAKLAVPGDAPKQKSAGPRPGQP